MCIDLLRYEFIHKRSNGLYMFPTGQQVYHFEIFVSPYINYMIKVQLQVNIILIYKKHIKLPL